jgi:hypothetical protein
MICSSECSHCRKHLHASEAVNYFGYDFHADCFIKRIRAHVVSLEKRADIFRSVGITEVEECQEVVHAQAA